MQIKVHISDNYIGNDDFGGPAETVPVYWFAKDISHFEILPSAIANDYNKILAVYRGNTLFALHKNWMSAELVEDDQ